MLTLLFIIMILLLVGTLPVWPYSRGWGYWPGGIIGVILILLILFMLTGRV